MAAVTGWITTELFQSWLCDHFLKHAISQCPLLLLLYGHNTHYKHSSAIQILASESNRGSSTSQAQKSKRQRTSLNNDFSGNTVIQDPQLQSNDSSAIQSENCADNQTYYCIFQQ